MNTDQQPLNVTQLPDVALLLTLDQEALSMVVAQLEARSETPADCWAVFTFCTYLAQGILERPKYQLSDAHLVGRLVLKTTKLLLFAKLKQVTLFDLAIVDTYNQLLLAYKNAQLQVATQLAKVENSTLHHFSDLVTYTRLQATNETDRNAVFDMFYEQNAFLAQDNWADLTKLQSIT